MKRSLFTVFAIIFLPLFSIHAQVDDLKESFLAAESYFLFEEYNEALPLYLRIHRADPDNDNVNFKIGVCFLNDPYQKDKSIRYLEDASKNINPRYKENNYKERTAPIEAFFYLGNAYLVNNNIAKALENYNYFREILDERIYDVELVEEQIRICETAKKLMKLPVDFDVHTLPALVNTRFTDKNPIVSGNGKRLVFVSEQRFYDATFFAEKVNGEWQPPRNIIPELGVDGDVYPTYLSYDGTLMIIYRNDDFVGNLYQSEYIDGRWTAMEKIGDNINTKYWESHGSLSKDGNTLYFTSNRKGGFGGLDIYRAEKQGNGSWGEPVNLGETINSRYNEETPFITDNGEMLYFSSYGHYNMGGYDIFYSRKISDENWDTPVNLGYPINTTGNDLFFQPVNNGANAYYSMVGDVTQGLHDIYYLDVYSDNNPRMYMITGFLDTDKGALTVKDDVGVYLINSVTGDTVDRTLPNYNLNNFTVHAPQGIYDLLIRSNTFKDAVYPIEINSETDKEGITLDEKLALETKPYVPKVLTDEENKIELDDIPVNVKSGELLKIKMKLEKDATLYAKVFNDTLQTAADTFHIDKRRFTYEVLPKPGLNTIELELIDEIGDISKRTIMVYAEEDKNIPDTSTVTSVPDVDIAPVIEAETAPLSLQDSINQSLEEITEHLGKYAEGELKNTIEELDIAGLELSSTAELLEHLENLSEEKEYSIADIDKAVANSVSGGDGEILYDQLLKHAEGELKTYLENLDPESVDIRDAELLMQHLREAADNNEFDPEQLRQASAFAMNNVNNDAELLKQQMLKHAEGPLKSFLESLDLKALNIHTREELMEYMQANIEGLGMDADELEIFRTLAESDSDAGLFKALLMQNTYGPLYEYLQTLDLEAEGITTNEELIAHLLEAAENEEFTNEDVINAIKYINNEVSPVKDALNQFTYNADGALKAYLEQLNMAELGIFTPEQLIQHLIEMAGKEFLFEEILSMFSNLLEDVDPSEFLDFMIKNGPGSQRDFLKKIDLENEGIYTIADLLGYLLEHSDELGMNKNGLMKTLVELLGDFYHEFLAPKFEVPEDRFPTGWVAGGGLLAIGLGVWLILFWKRRRKKEENEVSA